MIGNNIPCVFDWIVNLALSLNMEGEEPRWSRAYTRVMFSGRFRMSLL